MKLLNFFSLHYGCSDSVSASSSQCSSSEASYSILGHLSFSSIPESSNYTYFPNPSPTLPNNFSDSLVPQITSIFPLRRRSVQFSKIGWVPEWHWPFLNFPLKIRVYCFWFRLVKVVEWCCWVDFSGFCFLFEVVGWLLTIHYYCCTIRWIRWVRCWQRWVPLVIVWEFGFPRWSSYFIATDGWFVRRGPSRNYEIKCKITEYIIMIYDIDHYLLAYNSYSYSSYVG